MRRRLYFKLKKSLYAFVVLLVCLIAQDNHLSARQVSGNIVQAHNSTLPSLSERNGVNSRYLSAASTASLAAATVAAANGGLPSNQNQNQANNNQEATRNFLLHQQPQQQQQLQQQQQQQVSAVVNSAQVNNQPVISQQTQAQPQQQQQQQQQSSGVAVQAPQFNSAQPQQVPNTPIMSTTFTFNPITGQFVPSDLSTGTIVTGPPLQQPGATYGQQPLAGFLGQPFGGSQALPFPFNQYAHQLQRQGYQQQPVSSQFGNFGGQFGVNPLTQVANQQRQVSQFSRRQGNASPQRFSNNNYNQQQQNIEDDSGFFQQQVPNSGGLLSGITSDNINNNNNFGPDYGILPSNSYLTANQHHLSNQQQQQQAYQDHPISSQSSSATRVILPTSTTFNTAFSGPPPSGLEYKNDQCVAADNRHGTCYQASECIKKGGTPMGKCGASSSVNDFSGSTSYVCCLFDITCGQFAAERFVYFRNPNYPNTFDQNRMCRAKIGKLDKGVCQFRLDLLRFDIAKPTNGNCSTDMFVVSGQNENYVIPKICGLNDGQHYYVGVDESGVITLHMMMMGFYRRSFEILITQIPCRSDYSAPAHCLQYYMGTHGTIKSFNYDDETSTNLQSSASVYDLLQQANQQQDVINNGGPPYGLQFANNGQLQQRQQILAAAVSAGNNPNRYNIYGSTSNSNNNNNLGQYDLFGGYPNDLDYTMCIRKESGFCSITYQLSRNEQGLQPFAVGHSLFGGLNETAIGHSTNWHPVSTECRDDYLLIGGVRLCSGISSSNQYNVPIVGTGLPFVDNPNGASIQFAQNGTVLNSAGINQAGLNQVQLQHQLQNQYNLLMQQLTRLQQQQQQVTGNVSYSTNGLTSSGTNQIVGQQQQQQQTGSLGSNNNSLEQQQAAILQQAMFIQQQLNQLASNNVNANNNSYNSNNFSNNRFPTGQYPDTQGGAIITDTTSGPFLLRFVSNMARNARGFQIDYRQNPCK